MNLKRIIPDDYFQLYSIKRISSRLERIKAKQKMLLQKMHPDLFVNSTTVEKKLPPNLQLW